MKVNEYSDLMFSIMDASDNVDDFIVAAQNDDEPVWFPSITGPTPPLFWAIIHERINICKWLLENGADPNWRQKHLDMSLLDWSSVIYTDGGPTYGNPEIEPLLLTYGAQKRTKPRRYFDDEGDGY